MNCDWLEGMPTAGHGPAVWQNTSRCAHGHEITTRLCEGCRIHHALTRNDSELVCPCGQPIVAESGAPL